jgi:hypothetical protein
MANAKPKPSSKPKSAGLKTPALHVNQTPPPINAQNYALGPPKVSGIAAVVFDVDVDFAVNVAPGASARQVLPVDFVVPHCLPVSPLT